MYLLTYHAHPNDKYIGDTVAGSFINCWIETDSIKNADNIARKEITELNWDIIERTEAIEVDENYYDKDTPKVEYYEQALIDKRVYVFYNYTADNKKRTRK